jgi:hypothetical protein
MVPVENQLAAGQPAVQEQRRIQPATSRAVEPEEELDYVELDAQRQREPLRQRRYLDEEESRYEQPRYEESRYGESRDDESRYGSPRRPLEPEPVVPESRYSEPRPVERRPLEARQPERRPAPTPSREPLDVDAEDLPDPW